MPPACRWLAQDTRRQVPLPQEVQLWWLWPRISNHQTVEQSQRKWTFCRGWDRILPRVNSGYLMKHFTTIDSAYLIPFKCIYGVPEWFVLTLYIHIHSDMIDTETKLCPEFPVYNIYLQLLSQFIYTTCYSRLYSTHYCIAFCHRHFMTSWSFFLCPNHSSHMAPSRYQGSRICCKLELCLVFELCLRLQNGV